MTNADSDAKTSARTRWFERRVKQCKLERVSGGGGVRMGGFYEEEDGTFVLGGATAWTSPTRSGRSGKEIEKEPMRILPATPSRKIKSSTEKEGGNPQKTHNMSQYKRKPLQDDDKLGVRFIGARIGISSEFKREGPACNEKKLAFHYCPKV